LDKDEARAFVANRDRCAVPDCVSRRQLGRHGRAIGDLVEAAKKEGALTIIAVPHDWCNYREAVANFKSKYPFLKLNELDPDAGSGDEIEAIKANKGNKGPQAPDVIDVGLSFGPSSKAEGLIQPYKVSAWDSIPEHQKDLDGYWYGDYYGVLAFEVNADLVPNPPQDWADLKKPEYANMVALSGDPRTSACSQPAWRCRAAMSTRPRRKA
jgi:putative spermidine/putrescine transport system substrate-binding protein